MADGEEKSTDFYGVLELKKECTTAELRNAYKKLALKWHPDRCSALGNSEHMELAKKKFQAIQEAYFVLSDSNRRFLYDLGIHDFDDQDDENEEGMVNFLNEMVSMMSSHEANDNGSTSFEELQELFNDMFESDIESFPSSSFSSAAAPPTSSSSHHTVHSDTCCANKRNSSQMSSGNLKAQATIVERFCPVVDNREERVAASGEDRRKGRKQKTSLGHDVSSDDDKDVVSVPIQPMQRSPRVKGPPSYLKDFVTGV